MTESVGKRQQRLSDSERRAAAVGLRTARRTLEKWMGELRAALSDKKLKPEERERTQRRLNVCRSELSMLTTFGFGTADIGNESVWRMGSDGQAADYLIVFDRCPQRLEDDFDHNFIDAVTGERHHLKFVTKEFGRRLDRGNFSKFFVVVSGELRNGACPLSDPEFADLPEPLVEQEEPTPAPTSEPPEPETVVLVYDTPGTYTFIVPDDVIGGLLLEGFGAGGSGSGNGPGSSGGGGGGGGGGYARLNSFAVSPGQELEIQVGAGGNSTTSATGNNGGSSRITINPGEDDEEAILLATGGQGGQSDDGGLGGSGNIGDVTHIGGDGGTSDDDAGAGGGSSAGPSSDGNDGQPNISTTPGAGGAAVTDGGKGGNGGTNGANNAQAGVQPGGGGGGEGGEPSDVGAAGGHGRIRITYTAA